MNRGVTTTLITLAVATFVAGCGGSSGSDNSSEPVTCNTSSRLYAPMQGIWRACFVGSPSRNVTLSVTGCDVAVSVHVFGSADCTGTVTAAQFGSVVASFGNDRANVPFYGQPTWAPVTATELGITGTVNGAPLFPPYLLGYVSSDTPRRLYIGIPNPPMDGSTAATRTAALGSDPYFTSAF